MSGTGDAAKLANGHARRVMAVSAVLSAVIIIPVVAVLDFRVEAIIFLAFPVLILNDRFRYEWLQDSRGDRALVMDACWLTAQASLCLVFARSAWSPDANTAILCWIAGAALALLLRQRNQISTLPSWRVTWRWLMDARTAILSLTTQVLVASTAGNSPAFIFSLIGHPIWSAAYAASSTALGPQLALLAAVKPALFRRFAHVPFTGIGRRVWVGFPALNAVVLAVGVAAIFVLGEEVFGPAGQVARQLILWLSLGRLIGVYCFILNGRSRGVAMWRETLVIESAFAVIGIGASLILGNVIGPVAVIPTQSITLLGVLAAYAVVLYPLSGRSSRSAT